MQKRIIILGTGGNCIDILDVIDEINKHSPKYLCIGFLDDDEQSWGKVYRDISVLGPLTSASMYEDCFFVNGIGHQHDLTTGDGNIPGGVDIIFGINDVTALYNNIIGLSDYGPH